MQILEPCFFSKQLVQWLTDSCVLLCLTLQEISLGINILNVFHVMYK